MSKILIIDLETSPNMAFVWGFYKQNISANMTMEHGQILSAACKWLDDDEVFYWDTRDGGEVAVVRNVVDMLDQADIVVAHNGNAFDLKWINYAAIKHQIGLPSPYKKIDTLLVARSQFRFPRNTLALLAEILGVSMKSGHKKFPGFSLWEECLKGNEEAWEEMKAYNIQDIISLEEVYVKLRPWMPNHPNLGVLSESTDHVCPKCGSHHLQRRGFYTTNTGKYQRYQCNDCGGWSRTRRTELPKEVGKVLLTNAS